MKRIVKLTLKPERVAEFIEKFPARKEKILASGCHSVELLRDKADSRVFFTISEWDNEAALNAYRNSDFFKEIWAYMKQGFDDKPQAWSLENCF